MHTPLVRERCGDAVRDLVRGTLQEILEEEMTESLGAAKSERSSGRLGYRSGYCKRSLATRVGGVELCGHGFSASTASRINAKLDAELGKFAERAQEGPFLT